MEDDTSSFLLCRVARDGWQMMKYFSHLYNFLFNFVVNVFVFKLPDVFSKYSSVFLFYVGE